MWNKAVFAVILKTGVFFGYLCYLCSRWSIKGGLSDCATSENLYDMPVCLSKEKDLTQNHLFFCLSERDTTLLW